MRVIVNNFGPIKSASIEIKPIVLFIGKNESGKTYLSLLIKSFISAIHYLIRIEHDNITRRELQKFVDLIKLEGRIVLEEKFLEKFKDILSRFLKKIFLRMLKRYFLTNLSDLININESFTKILFEGSRACFVIEIPREGDIKSELDFKFRTLEILVEVKEIKPQIEAIGPPVFAMKGYGIKTKYKFERDTLMIKMHVDVLGEITDYPENEIHMAIIKNVLFNLLKIVFDVPARAFYIPSSRAGIMEFIDVINRGLILSEVIRVPYYLREAIDLFRRYLDAYDIVPPDMKSAIRNISQELYLGSFEVIKTTKRRILGYKIDSTTLPIHLTSSMVKETYPLLIHIPFITRGALLIIEEPEAHLHPDNLLKLARFLVKLINEHACHIIISTHSDILLQAIAIELMRQAIDEKNIIDAKFYLFEMKEKEKTNTKEIEFSLESGLSETLADVYEELYSEFTRLRMKFIAQNEA